MAKRNTSSEKTKQILLVVLAVGLVGALVYQFFLSGPSPKPRRNAQAGEPTKGSSPTANSPATTTTRARPQGQAAQQEAIMQALLADTTPLNLRLTNGAGKSDPGSRGNIFAYYVEPPKPPPPPPPPPPIQLISIQPQTAVAGTPRPITLVVNGNKIPADAQILIDGSPRNTKRVSETQLSTEISAGDYSSPRGMTIEVKSKSNPAENSNTIQFVAQAAPEPQFVYKGRLGTLGQEQQNFAVIELTTTREVRRAKVGETIIGGWRVDAITANAMDVTLTQYDIKRRVQLQERPK